MARLTPIRRHAGRAALVFIGVFSACDAPPEPECPVGFLRSAIDIEPAMLDFGAVPVGAGVVSEVVIRNTGSAVLTFGVEKGPLFGEGIYAVEGASGTALEPDLIAVAPDGLSVLRLHFSPPSEGPFSSSLRVETNVLDENCARRASELPIAGVGVQGLAVSESQLDFQGVVAGTTEDQSFTLQNISTVDLEVELVEDPRILPCESAPDPSRTFCILSSEDHPLLERRFRLAAGESVPVGIRFEPRVAGFSAHAQLEFRTCASSACSTRVDVSGQAIEALLRCRPSEVDLGLVNPGATRRTPISCQNLTGAPLRIEGASLARSSNPAFELAAISPRELGVGESAFLEVAFAPVVLGRARGTLNVETTHPNPAVHTVAVPLVGHGGGPTLEVRPAALDFGPVSRSVSSRRNLVLTNVGYAPLTVSGVEVDIAGTGTLTSTLAHADVIPPGASRSITLEFRPRELGPVATFVRVASNDSAGGLIEIPVTGEGIDLPPCRYRITPSRLAFGAVPVGRPLRRSFEVHNEGEGPCLISGARWLEGSSPAFTLPNTDPNLRIDAGAQETVAVETWPLEEGPHKGRVELSISSPTAPFPVVELTARATGSALLAAPDALDFGSLEVGCLARSGTVTLHNTSTETMLIHALELARPVNPVFDLLTRPEPLPAAAHVLRAGQFTAFSVGFRADAVSAYTSAVELDVSVGGRRRGYRVPLAGRGNSDARQVDVFQLPERHKVDVVFVVDGSRSMEDEQMFFGSNFQAFLQYAQALGIDFQLGVTTLTPGSGAGRLVSARPGEARSASIEGPPELRIITPRTAPSPSAAFAANVSLAPAPDGGEAGLRAAELALTDPDTLEHNAGFLRPDAALSIVFVSDAPDQSNLLGGSAAASVDHYVDLFRSLKGFRNTHRFSASAITAGNGRCRGPGGTATAIGRYLAVAEQTGGVFQSICTTDWFRAPDPFSSVDYVFRSRFFLSRTPVPETLRVFVDDAELPEITSGGTVNWTFDFATNLITFAPFAFPEPGARLRFEYEVPPCYSPGRGV